MKKSVFSVLFALVFALTLTLPAFPNTGPPAPKTENIVKKEVNSFVFQSSVTDHSVIAITPAASACRDVGQSKNHVVQNDMETQNVTVYKGSADRLYLPHKGYIAKRPCKGTSDKIRPPNKV